MIITFSLFDEMTQTLRIPGAHVTIKRRLHRKALIFLSAMRYLSKKVENPAETQKSSSSPFVKFGIHFTFFAKLQLIHTEFEVRPKGEVVTHTLLHHPTRGISAVPSRDSPTVQY